MRLSAFRFLVAALFAACAMRPLKAQAALPLPIDDPGAYEYKLHQKG
jgi:hypothetical protein